MRFKTMIAAGAIALAAGAIVAPSLPPFGMASAHDAKTHSEDCKDVKATFENFPEGKNDVVIMSSAGALNKVTKSFDGTSGTVTTSWASIGINTAIGDTVTVEYAWTADGGGSYGPFSFDATPCVPMTPSEASATASIDCVGNKPTVTVNVLVTGPRLGTQLSFAFHVNEGDVFTRFIDWVSKSYTTDVSPFVSAGTVIKVRLVLDGEVIYDKKELTVPDCSPPPPSSSTTPTTTAAPTTVVSTTVTPTTTAATTTVIPSTTMQPALMAPTMPPSSTLPSTGSKSAGGSLIALVALMAGVILVLIARRRQSGEIS